MIEDVRLIIEEDNDEENDDSFNEETETKNPVRGEIWFASLGEPVGSEQAGDRPVVIVQNDVGNHYSNTTQIVPISKFKPHKKKLPTHVILEKSKYKIKNDSVVHVEQIRTIDKRRLQYKLTQLDDDMTDLIINRILMSIDKLKYYERKRKEYQPD